MLRANKPKANRMNTGTYSTMDELVAMSLVEWYRKIELRRIWAR